MNKKVFCISLMIPFIVGTSLAEGPIKEKGKPVDVRVVDSFALMRETEEAKEISQELQEKYKEYATGIQKDNEKFEKAATEFKGKEAMLSESARENEQKRLMTMKRSLESKIQECEEDYKRAAAKATERISKIIIDTATEIGKAENLDAIQDKDTGRFLYVSDKVNYTEKVKHRMDEKYAVNQKSAPKKTTQA
jgi:Skp family chaperone for outer membrane proteins